jgi:hypothetical protein
MQKLILEQILKQSTRVAKSVTTAYQHVINQSGNASGGGSNTANETIEKMKEKVGAITKPMTRDEALEILNIEPDAADIDIVGEGKTEEIPELIMKRFDILSEKNSAERGGSFYIRSKIYFAKE